MYSIRLPLHRKQQSSMIWPGASDSVQGHFFFTSSYLLVIVLVFLFFDIFRLGVLCLSSSATRTVSRWRRSCLKGPEEDLRKSTEKEDCCVQEFPLRRLSWECKIIQQNFRDQPAKELGIRKKFSSASKKDAYGSHSPFIYLKQTSHPVSLDSDNSLLSRLAMSARPQNANT